MALLIDDMIWLAILEGSPTANVVDGGGNLARGTFVDPGATCLVGEDIVACAVGAAILKCAGHERYANTCIKMRRLAYVDEEGHR